MTNSMHNLIWGKKITEMGFWRQRLFIYLQTVAVIFRELGNGRLTLHAMGLVYTTQLSIVPMLAVSFSILKGMGVHNKMEPVLLNFLEPLGAESARITGQIIIFVENAQLGVLGSVGFLMLIFSITSLLNKVESSFNLIWQIKQSRTFTRRFSDFLSVLVIGSLLLISAVSLSTASINSEWGQWLFSIKPIGFMAQMAPRFIPFMLTLTTFTLLYAFIPNTKVEFFAALMGGLTATILWKASGWVVASFVISSPNLTAIYSTFVGIVLFMIWLYVGWLIALIGASVSFYHQYPEYLTYKNQELKLSNRMQEHLSLLVLYWVGQNHYNRKPAWTIATLAKKADISVDHMTGLVMTLKEAGVLYQSEHFPPSFAPGCPFGTTSVHEVLQTIRTANEAQFICPAHLPLEPITQNLMTRIDDAVGVALDEMTLKDFVLTKVPANQSD